MKLYSNLLLYDIHARFPWIQKEPLWPVWLGLGSSETLPFTGVKTAHEDYYPGWGEHWLPPGCEDFREPRVAHGVTATAPGLWPTAQSWVCLSLWRWGCSVWDMVGILHCLSSFQSPCVCGLCSPPPFSSQSQKLPTSPWSPDSLLSTDPSEDPFGPLQEVHGVDTGCMKSTTRSGLWLRDLGEGWASWGPRRGP